jgi:hypothetical protein
LKLLGVGHGAVLFRGRNEKSASMSNATPCTRCSLPPLSDALFQWKVKVLERVRLARRADAAVRGVGHVVGARRPVHATPLPVLGTSTK